jgi:hypothetical protein
MDQHTHGEIDEITRLLDGLARQRFFGEVTIKFHEGAVTLVRKVENLKVGVSDWNNRRRDLGDEREQR